LQHTDIGRYCQLEHDTEVNCLEAGMDFRHPRYRREVFLRFYEFHLKYRSHPGAVYYVFPYLFEQFKMTPEQRLWFAFINGNTQHPVTSLRIWQAFPDFKKVNQAKLTTWFNARYETLAFDTDRRYHRKEFLTSVSCYQNLVGRNTQEDYFLGLGGQTEEERFRAAWPVVSKQFWSFGRLSSFSYLEYLRLAGLPLDCGQLFLEDMSGSKSHRNGLAKVLGRDDLDWHRSTGFDGKYAPGQVDWLREEAAALRKEARRRMARKPYVRDVGYFTLESALCTYKSWHRPNRRYPNCYNDMFFNRIKQAPAAEQQVFWAARRAALPAYLRLEDTPGDPGLSPRKQNWHRETGQVIMMDKDWPCFKNDFNKGEK
jgi:hypothetical protein